MNIVLINTFHNKAQIFKHVRKDINFQIKKNEDYRIELSRAQYKFYLESLCGNKKCDCDKTSGDEYFFLIKNDNGYFIGFKKKLKNYFQEAHRERLKMCTNRIKIGNKNEN